MRLTFLQKILLLLGCSVVLHALSIPLHGENDVTRREEVPGSIDQLGHLDARSPKGRGGGRPPRTRPSRPSSRPTSSKSKTNPIPSQSPKPSTSTKPVSSSTTQKPTTSTKPSSSSTTQKPTTTQSSASAVKPLPFTLPPRPTKGYDICLVSGVTCLNDLGAENEAVRADVRRSEAVPKLEKRARELAKIPLKSGPLQVTPKAYYSSGQMARGEAGSKWEELWVDFENDKLNDAGVKLFNKKPPQPPPYPEHEYVTEHILELQSIPRFIESVTQTSTKSNSQPIKLSATIVDPKWFNDWWNKDVQAKVDTRKPFKGYENSKNAQYKDKSLNDVVFEAFGSTRNVEDFLLCEDAINTAKAKLWKGEAPISPRRWNTMSSDAAKGWVPTNEHLSGLRTTLAVYNYMHLPKVTKKLQSSIANVKAEFENVNHLTNNSPPKDSKGKDVDLAALWMEFMDKQLAKFVESGDNWLQKSIASAKKAYNAEYANLETWKKKMPSIKQDIREQKRNDAIKARTAVVNQLPKAEKVLEQAAEDLEKVVEDLMVKYPDDDDKRKTEMDKKGGPYKTKQTALSAAKTKVTNAKKNIGKATRKILEFDQKELAKEMKNMKDILALLDKFEAERKQMKPLKAR